MDEIRLLGFGDFEENGRNAGRWHPESFKINKSPENQKKERVCFIRGFKFLFNHYYSDYLQKEKIKLLFENENSYSRIVEEVRH